MPTTPLKSPVTAPAGKAAPRAAGPLAPAPRALVLALLALAVVSAIAAVTVPLGYRHLAAADPAYGPAFATAHLPPLIRVITAFAAASALACAAAWRIASTVRKPVALAAVRWLLLPGYALVALYLYTTVKIIDLFMDAGLPVRESTLDLVSAAWLKWRYNAPALLMAIALAALYLLTWRPRVVALYAGSRADAPASAPVGSVASIPKPDDAIYRSSVMGSVAAHVLVIIILPWMLQTRGCTALTYMLPGGGGGGGGGGGADQAEVQKAAQVVKVRKAPPRRKMIFRANSALSFAQMTMDESKVAQELDQMTQQQYEHTSDTTSTGKAGPGGPGEGFGGGGGKGGGWPGGQAGAPIRFIRLQYAGERWDDGMDAASRADVNFLDEVKKASGLRVAGGSEAITPAQLRAFKRGAAPPFVFMTGEGNIDMPEGDIRAIKQYLQEGGMIFADCGSPQWHNSFRSFIARVFPDKPLLDISNDDPIFKVWFPFPNGAPPLWHHGGTRSLGIKIDGRWAVFYFPGDMNDAWKTGHNDAGPAVVRQAFQLGINVVKYSFDQYWAMYRPASSK